MNFKRLVGASVLSGFLVFSPFLAFPASAIFDATVSVVISQSQGITVTIQQPAGTEIDDYTIYRIPAGFDFASGSSFSNGAQIGSGTFTAVFSGTELTFPFVLLNDTNLQGHKFRLRADFAPQPTIIDIFLDGDVTTGHTFRVNTPQSVIFTTPLTTVFNFSAEVGGVPLVTFPTLAGEYTFIVEFYKDTEVVTKTFVTNLPAQTPSGTNVTNDFNGGISINFNRVLGQGGQTTITSSASPPAAGTGEFQLSGVYYDFNTTANIRCPCTVTIPYDPVTTPNPRIYHLEDGVWVDATTSVDTVNHTVTGTVSSFSFFAVGSPNYSVDWQKKIEKSLEKDNPFDIKEDKKLKIEFGLLDADGQKVSPENVTVEVWQILDEGGNPVGPTKTATLTPDLKEKKDQFKAELNLRETELALGTYEIRVLVDNTTASQTPETASFTVVEKK